MIDERQQVALEAADPHNVVRLILPRGDRSGPRAGYQRAARTLRSWLADGILSTDPVPCLYVYRMRYDGSAVAGLIGAVGLRQPETGVVLPHEDTWPGPVRQRRELIAATQANLEPIYLVSDGPAGAASRAVTATTSEPPIVGLRAEDGTTHEMWSIADPAILAEIAADLAPRRALIADGHHRYAAYLEYQAARRADGAGPGHWDYGLALLVDANAFGAQVQAFHRVVIGLTFDEALRRSAGAFDIAEITGGERSAMAMLADAGAVGPAFVVTDGSRWRLLTQPRADLLDRTLPARHTPTWQTLDAVILQHGLIEATWHLAVTEDTVRYVADLGAALALARHRDGLAVLMNPTPLEKVLAVASTGERMPQKSTLFAPKPRTGLVMRTYGGAGSGGRPADR